MALLVAPFVKESSTTTGDMTPVANITLAGAESGFQSFNSGIGTGSDCIATLRHNTAWMIFYGRLTSSTNLRVLSFISSSSGSPLNLGAGTKYLYISAPPYSHLGSGIINGGFDIWQMGNTFAAAATGTKTADMWKWYQSGAGVVTVNRSTNVPTVSEAGKLLNYSLEVDVTTADASIAAGDFYGMGYRMEGFDWRNFAQREFTLGFWVLNTITGTYHVSFTNSGADRSYIGSYTQDISG